MADHGVYDELDGATVLVTGSSRNLGRAIAATLGAVGANVGVHARSDREGCETTAAAVEDAGGAATVAMGDLADPGDIESVVAAVRGAFGPVDVLVNNAAIRPLRPFEEISLDDWQHVQDVNLRSAFLLAQHVAPGMRERGDGAILNVLGQMALRGRREKAHVAVSKAGLVGLTLTLAAELGPDGVRTNAVVPGRKLRTDHDPANQRDLEATQRKVEQATPMRRRGDPEEVARAVRFLASAEASYVNGEVFTVDGGLNPVFDLDNVDIG